MSSFQRISSHTQAKVTLQTDTASDNRNLWKKKEWKEEENENLKTNKKTTAKEKNHKPTHNPEFIHGNLWEILKPKWVFCGFFVCLLVCFW